MNEKVIRSIVSGHPSQTAGRPLRVVAEQGSCD